MFKCPNCGSTHVEFIPKWSEGDNPYDTYVCKNCGEETIVDDDD